MALILALALALAVSLGAHPTLDKSIAVAPFHRSISAPFPSFLPSFTLFVSPFCSERLKQCSLGPANKAGGERASSFLSHAPAPARSTKPLSYFILCHGTIDY